MTSTTTKPETEEARQAALASGRRIGKSINTAQQFSEEPRDTLDDAAKKRLARLWKRTRGAGKWTA